MSSDNNYTTFDTPTTEGSLEEKKSNKIITMAKMLVVFGGISLMVSAKGKIQNSSQEMSAMENQNFQESTTTSSTTAVTNPFADWRIQKYTLNVHSNSGMEIQDFFSEFFCESKTTCPSDLGCGSYRSWCSIASPYDTNEFTSAYDFELHWVDSNTLNDFTSDETGIKEMDLWIEYFIKLNNEMSNFNAFMHNKIQLYLSDLTTLYQRLIDNNVNTMKRLSLDSDNNEVLHIGFEMAGRVYEFVGDNNVDDINDVSFWDENEECGIIHKLSKPLSYYKTITEDSDYPTFESMPSAMVVGISVSYHDPIIDDDENDDDEDDAAKISTLYNHLTSFTGAILSETINDETCQAMTLTWEAMPGFTFHYVNNIYGNNMLEKGYTLKDYDIYASSLHAYYSSKEELSSYNGDWYGWDHMMDQHVGFWYSGSDGNDDGETSADIGTCSARASSVRQALSEANLAVGERAEPDAHEMYVGYAGPMTWEYQFENCDAGKPDAPAECACIGSNNDQDYATESGKGCTEASDDWCT